MEALAMAVAKNVDQRAGGGLMAGYSPGKVGNLAGMKIMRWRMDCAATQAVAKKSLHRRIVIV
ncbi:TPA: hypothetical protein L6B08_11505 [Pseudomonas aeruginosa]|nr:hypothetical protein AO882_25350 [Pseudomonas paraeruginosa]KSC83302.1 hypothetical protein AO896_24055 [Pseudomonas aeruginosa]KSD16669.1 hypothetical protein AO898_22365 [Pseudomonas aeruginosa]KSG46048.1 hypothetical protein AO955_22045 [Pseudomonas aeruginosa]KSL07730.1 hypothetical protein APA44_24530 [Pseudomonas aeruginosa]